MMLVSKKFIPSLFTILNAFCGLMSIINASNQMFDEACLFIVYAALFDMIDGVAARITKSSSEFGVELDSLSDVISFGAAPSFLLYSIYFKEYNGLGIAISSMIMVFSAIRLARFNISLVGFDKDKFTGVPTPMASITLVSYLLMYHNKIFTSETSKYAIFLLSLGLAFMMVSKFKYITFPKPSWSNAKANPLLYSGFILAVILTLLTKGSAVFPLCILYIISGIIGSIISLFQRPLSSKPRLNRRHRHRR
ncbi:CDP-diacylglycerol--serine O-phosphatidyltransferase [bacterium]|nr:MAG: CDP-diacylglycerol--serine O-phosphatidyltransferase [bacterium]